MANVFIKDLIALPEQVNRGDFVLRLTEGVAHPDATVDSYVVAPQLEKCFDAALALIKSAVKERTSKAAYLHGSFGSGKSHFMAVLHLILQGNGRARSIPELASVIAKHNGWIPSGPALEAALRAVDEPAWHPLFRQCEDITELD